MNIPTFTPNDDLVRCPGCNKKPTPVGDGTYRCDGCCVALKAENCALSLPYMVWDAHAFICECIAQMESRGFDFHGIRSDAYSAVSLALKATRWECLEGADKLLDRGVWRRRFNGEDQWYSGPSCDGQPETEEPYNFHKTEADAFAAYWQAKNEPPED